MKNYYSFQRSTVTPFLWLDLLCYIAVFSVVFCGVDLFLTYFFPESFAPNPHDWISSIANAIVLTLVFEGCRILRYYPEKNELTVFASLRYHRIVVDHISIIMIYKKRKLRNNTIIITDTGRKYKVSVKNYQEFSRLLTQHNPQITVRDF